jgi:uncharacterized coiled-coil protein SlyX
LEELAVQVADVARGCVTLVDVVKGLSDALGDLERTVEELSDDLDSLTRRVYDLENFFNPSDD